MNYKYKQWLTEYTKLASAELASIILNLASIEWLLLSKGLFSWCPSGAQHPTKALEIKALVLSECTLFLANSVRSEQLFSSFCMFIS